MMPSDEGVPAGGSREAQGRERTAPKQPEVASAQVENDLVLVTLKASTGSIVKVEAIEPDGSRHELSAADTVRLAGERPTFSSLVHDAFEAGVACILDDGATPDENAAESKEEAELHDALLDALMERSGARRLLSREILASAVLGTIISEASNGGHAPKPPPA